MIEDERVLDDEGVIEDELRVDETRGVAEVDGSLDLLEVALGEMAETPLLRHCFPGTES